MSARGAYKEDGECRLTRVAKKREPRGEQPLPYRVGLFTAEAKTREQLTLADGLSADAEPSERVAPATARAVTCSDFAGSFGFALSDSESGDPKPTPSQTDGRRCRDALGDHQQPHGRHVRRTGVVHV